jgi:hypothetical protein
MEGRENGPLIYFAGLVKKLKGLQAKLCVIVFRLAQEGGNGSIVVLSEQGLERHTCDRAIVILESFLQSALILLLYGLLQVSLALLLLCPAAPVHRHSRCRGPPEGTYLRRSPQLNPLLFSALGAWLQNHYTHGWQQRRSKEVSDDGVVYLAKQLLQSLRQWNGRKVREYWMLQLLKALDFDASLARNFLKDRRQ